MQSHAECYDIFKRTEVGLPIGTESGCCVIQKVNAEHIAPRHQKRMGNHVIKRRIGSSADIFFCLCRISCGLCLHYPSQEYRNGFLHVITEGMNGGGSFLKQPIFGDGDFKII